MASATAHPNHQLISSEDVEGTNVYDMKGTKIIAVADRDENCGGARQRSPQRESANLPALRTNCACDRAS